MNTNERIIALFLGGLILIGLWWVTKVTFLGTLMFAALWVILKRLPGFEWLATRCPIVVDLIATLGSFIALQAMGVASTTTFLAAAVAGLEVSIWVALLRDKRERSLRSASASTTPAQAGVVG